MITISVLHRSLIAAILPAALVLALVAPMAGAADQPLTEEDIFKAKCSLCHSGHRIYRLTPEQIRPVVERMRKINPDWITEVDSDHIIKVIAKILDKPEASAERTAWAESVSRGEALFNTATLGTTGKSCASCHTPGSLRNVEDAFPKFNPALKRFVDMQEAINLMIRDKLKGTPIPPNDQKYFDLLAYLKSLK
jgi:cytochrome c